MFSFFRFIWSFWSVFEANQCNFLFKKAYWIAILIKFERFDPSNSRNCLQFAWGRVNLRDFSITKLQLIPSKAYWTTKFFHVQRFQHSNPRSLSKTWQKLHKIFVIFVVFMCNSGVILLISKKFQTLGKNAADLTIFLPHIEYGRKITITMHAGLACKKFQQFWISQALRQRTARQMFCDERGIRIWEFIDRNFIISQKL